MVVTIGVSAKRLMEKNAEQKVGRIKLLEDLWTLGGGDNRCKCKRSLEQIFRTNISGTNISGTKIIRGPFDIGWWGPQV